ncbi:cysteine--tRNA ligase [Pseudonocardia sp. CNS-004]|nr:cysteine--tRNA ligase [Pseudonocardia sp. CNS-004]
MTVSRWIRGRVDMVFRLYNSLTRRKEIFAPMRPGVVRMFVCGPTVYDLSHVGHAKTYTNFDFVARYLRFCGYDVTYAQNITDVDDKVIGRARERGVAPNDIAEQFEAEYRRDMAALHNTGVDVYARATGYVDQVVRQVRRLIDRGHAYRLDDGWYFDLSTFPGYGKLSGRCDVLRGDSPSRIDADHAKRQHGDFVLWKARKPDEPFWPSELGPGRPGWHIEDTAITEALFGPQYDLHGGAVDLTFPHHEAEIAQMESASGLAPLARHWMHVGLLRIDGTKMAKSAGNSVTIKDALTRSDFRTLRFAFLSQHYRSSIDLTEARLEEAGRARRRVENFARSVDRRGTETDASRKPAEQARSRIFRKLDDDLDTPGALAVLFDFIREQNRTEARAGATAWQLLMDLDSLFDSFELDAPAGHDAEFVDAAVVDAAVARRRRMRAQGRFDEADAIRTELLELGVLVEDRADETRWRRIAVAPPYRHGAVPSGNSSGQDRSASGG